MKKTNRFASLFLAMLMAFSLMAVTAAAYGEAGHVHDETCAEETIQPRKPAALCPLCRQGMTEVYVGGEYNNHYSVFECHNIDCDYNGQITLYW